ncbi:hypothetical protein CPK_ORF00847 [Chlamydia pneumoniae LPCoLN]|uniref:Uncharacterized protein n=1 Tax=Chlamydia pneumoniae TaxID=83558 RepID=Q9K273_CHLPN|nr:hypothetical protein CP_0420 [Chlamydia pneumoniae AR39]ACZ33314.1 hypothetical protein CPK_ORF00847 [Chlamydia pneumoniae LPCoLN]CRI32838.1 Uncharacterized protein BN1224_Wien1_A_03450 [Chlamydia pneumoniae]CRI35701.1 Uncharacterized protein BN1224_CM1_A_03480 [Chlamydia pneumoniae]CRI36828.1 Uncharacterized protein BN1224_CV14_A_03470 [Chlamydia pneumoniae]
MKGYASLGETVEVRSGYYYKVIFWSSRYFTNKKGFRLRKSSLEIKERGF